MKKANQVEVIATAFMDTLTGKLPRKEKDYPQWYKDRLDTCALCDYSTENMPYSMLPFNQKVSKFFGKNRCHFCGCFIKQKCWSRVEECGLAEAGEKPKWNRLDVLTTDKDMFSMYNLEPGVYNCGLTEDGEKFYIQFNNSIKRNTTLDFNFALESKKPTVLSGIHTSCGCIKKVTPELQTETRTHYNAHIDTTNFAIGRFTRLVTIEYRLDNNDTEVKRLVVSVEGTVIE